MSIYSAKSLAEFDQTVKTVKGYFRDLNDAMVSMSRATRLTGLTKNAIDKLIEDGEIEYVKRNNGNYIRLIDLQPAFDRIAKEKRMRHRRSALSDAYANRKDPKRLSKITFDNASEELFMFEAAKLTGLKETALNNALKNKIYTDPAYGRKLIKKKDLQKFYDLIKHIEDDVSKTKKEDLPEVLTVKQVASVLDVSTGSVNNFISLGILQVHDKALGFNLIHKDDLNKIEERKRSRRVNNQRNISITEDSDTHRIARKVLNKAAINEAMNDFLIRHKKEKLTVNVLKKANKEAGYTDDELKVSVEELNKALSSKSAPDLNAFGVSYKVIRNLTWDSGNLIA